MNFRHNDTQDPEWTDQWTEEDNKRLLPFKEQFRKLFETSNYSSASREIIPLLRDKHPYHYSSEKRNDNALYLRLKAFDKVLAGEVNETTMHTYDRPFYRKFLRS